VESAVGAHLVALAAGDSASELFYWRNRVRGVDYEVDYVLKTPSGLVGIEVKSATAPGALAGLAAFEQAHDGARTLLVGEGGLSLEQFFESAWVTV
jgi:hypothetical protein